MKLIFCLMGATATGKTELACKLAASFPVEIISVDSVMIYRDMNIGSAKPDAATLATTPHHLIDIINPTASYSVANFCRDAGLLIDGIIGRGKIPLLVGGTMMYFHALQQGLTTLPPADPVIRAHILKQAQIRGWDEMHQELSRIDALSAAKIHPNDKQRIQRALEVHLLTKKSLSSLLNSQVNSSEYKFINISLMPIERAWLHQRIATRFEHMLALGLITELKDLIYKWQLNSLHSSMRSVGYRQALLYLQGKCDYTTLKDLAIAATRQLAKRQLTWLRNWPDNHIYAAENPASPHEVMRLIQLKLKEHIMPNTEQIACSAKSYIIHNEDLPLSCPNPTMKLYNAHPRVYLPMKANGITICPYCGTRFILKND